MRYELFGAWSLPLCRLFGVEVRIHWTLLLLTAFEAGRVIIAGAPWWWLPILVLIPFASVLLHEFGHVTAARLVGGQADKVVMWMFGGLAMCEVPHSPGRRFFVSAAGPLVTFMIMAVCLLVLQMGLAPDYRDAFAAQGMPGLILAYTGLLNLYLLAFNLIPCYPLDGGSMARAALWPLIGLRRATIVTIYLAYVCLAGFVVWGVSTGSPMLIILAVILAITVVQEHILVRRGFDPYLGEISASDGSTWIDRWRRDRRRARDERDERLESAEQDLLDRLLAKVTEHGLPSLTAKERRVLQDISKRQRERQGSGAR